MPSHGFTEPAQNALRTAQEIVQQKRHSQLDVEHILLTLLTPQHGLVPAIIQHLQVDPRALAGKLDDQLNSNPRLYSGYTGLAQIHISMRAQRVVSAAAEEAARLGDHFIGVEHLLLAIAAEHGGAAGGLLDEAGINPASIQAALEAIRDSGRQPDELPSTHNDGLSAEAQAALQRAQEYAQHGGDRLNADYILLALLNPRDGLASRIIEHLGGDPQGMHRTLTAGLALPPHWATKATVSGRAQQIVTRTNAGRVDVDHLLVEIVMKATDGLAPRLLREAGIDAVAIQAATTAIRSSLNDQ